MSISSAPRSTARRVHSIELSPREATARSGTPLPRLATFTGEPRRTSFATRDEVRIDCRRRRSGRGCRRCRADEALFWHIWRTLPGVSFPSSGSLRSIIRLASLRPATFVDLLRRALAERRRALLALRHRPAADRRRVHRTARRLPCPKSARVSTARPFPFPFSWRLTSGSVPLPRHPRIPDESSLQWLAESATENEIDERAKRPRSP